MSTKLTLLEWGYQYKSVERWLKTRQRSEKTLLSSFRQWLYWITENVTEFSGFSPDDFIEYQRSANVNGDDLDAQYLIGEKTMDLLIERGRSGKWRRGYQKKVLSSVRSFFKANRAELPFDELYRGINQNEAPDDSPEKLDLEVAKHVIDNSNEMYKAIFLAMIGGGLGVGEILKWSSQGVDSVKKGLFKVKGQELLKINFKSRKSNNLPYFTLIGGDALQALKKWLEVREQKKLTYEKKGSQYPDAIFVTNTNNAVTEDHTIRTYWLRKLDRIGRIKREKGAPPSTRYGFNPHQMRDRFKSQWMIAHRGTGDKISEFLMGHRIDSYNYNRFHESQAGQDVICEEYLKTLPYLNILSSNLPFGLVDSSTLAETNQEVDALKRQVQQLSQENISLQKNVDEYKHDFEQRFQRHIDELREEEHVINLWNRLRLAQTQLERKGMMIFGSDDVWDFEEHGARFVTEEDVENLKNELQNAIKKLNGEQLERVRPRLRPVFVFE